jgi:hypothetical protein
VHIQLKGHGAEWLVARNRRIAAVTMADARRTAERLFGDGALSVVLVGTADARRTAERLFGDGALSVVLVGRAERVRVRDGALRPFLPLVAGAG